MKLCTIVGARPQFIKAATVSRAIASTSSIHEIIIHTGQHYDANMSEQFFNELNIPSPGYHLSIGSGSHGKQTGEMLIAIEEVLLKEKPDWVLVYGDTNSTLAGALAAAKLKIPVAHIEAGLRSFNRNMPEEVNRITTDHLSTLLFVPTENGYKQLLKEGISQDKIAIVGDVMYDATLYYNEFNLDRETIVDSLNLDPKSYCLATIHRAENTDNLNRLRNICDALIELSHTKCIVLPLHPRTRSQLKKYHLLDNLLEYILIIEPVGYLDMLALEKNANIVITDSGGVQKEAYFNRVACITLRNETEWVELVDNGWNRLCPPDKPFSLLGYELHNTPNQAASSMDQLYGNGEAAKKIVEMICQ